MFRPTFNETLIVDMNRQTLSTEKAIAERAGYTVLVAENATTALKALGAFAPELVLVDDRLPIIEITQIVRSARTFNSQALVLIMSTIKIPSRDFIYMELGVNGFIQKPITIEHFSSKPINSTLAKDSLARCVKSAVGQIGIKELEKELRNAMVMEALHRVNGNLTQAADLLNVSRQFLQHVVRKSNN